MILCPVHPETPEPPDRKEMLELQVTPASRVLQVSGASRDQMELKETKDSMDFLDHLDDKDLKVQLEIREKKDLKASVLVENQVLRGSQDLLDSEDQLVNLMSGPQEPSGFQDHRALQDLKESPVPPATTANQVSWVFLGASE